MTNFNRIVKLKERKKRQNINIDFDCLNFNQIDYLIPVHFIFPLSHYLFTQGFIDRRRWYVSIFSIGIIFHIKRFLP